MTTPIVKSLSILMTCAIALALAACGSSGNNAANKDNTTQIQEARQSLIANGEAQLAAEQDRSPRAFRTAYCQVIDTAKEGSWLKLTPEGNLSNLPPESDLKKKLEDNYNSCKTDFNNNRGDATIYPGDASKVLAQLISQMKTAQAKVSSDGNVVTFLDLKTADPTSKGKVASNDVVAVKLQGKWYMLIQG